VTFEATPKIAEKIAVAQTIGQLSLSLRSLADNNAELERAIASGEVQVPHNADPHAERQMLLAVASQPNDTNTTFTVGADVSRFQRGTVPRRRSESSESAPRAVPTGIPAERIGPVVRVARGNNVTLVPVGAR
jgi:pilus assembly protein CpaB